MRILARIRAIVWVSSVTWAACYGRPRSTASNVPARSGVRKVAHEGPDISVGSDPGWAEPGQPGAGDNGSVGLEWRRGSPGSRLSPRDCRVLPGDGEHNATD